MHKSHLSSARSTSSPALKLANQSHGDCADSIEQRAPPKGFSVVKTPMAAPIKRRVLIAHIASLVRFGLTSLINNSEQFAICSQTDVARMARAMFVADQPELVVLGLTLRGGDGFELIRDFRRINSASGVLVVSAREDALSIQRAFRAGARGYASIKDDPEEILQALDQISAGRLYASSNVLPRLLENLARGEIGPANSELNALSDRELQVFSLIGRGFGVSRLASELHLSVKTIETYQAHLKEKLGLRTAAELSERATHWMLGSMRRNLRLKQQFAFARRNTPPEPGSCP